MSLLFTYAVAALGLAAAFFYVSPLFSGLLLVFLAVGLRWDWRGNHPLSSRVLAGMALPALGLAFLLPASHGPLSSLLGASIVLTGAKLLGPKTSRDHLQILLLSLGLLIGAAIVTVNLSFSILFFLYLLLSTAALTWLPFGAALGPARLERAQLGRVTRVWAVLAAASLPLVAVFFFALPRAGVPLWAARPPASFPVSGFAEQVQLGDVARIAQSNEPAFRVQLDRAGPLPEEPYWRGALFELTDGRSWRREPWAPRLEQPLPGAVSPARASYRVTLEPSGQSTLFTLDHPLALTSGVAPEYLGARSVAEAPRRVYRRLQYRALSAPAPWLAETLDDQARLRNLQLPAGLTPAAAALARQAAGSERSPLAKVEALLEHFRSGGYRYSLQAPAASGDPLEAFLTGSRTGFCEHFAVALTLMLRSQGVPARMIGGYHGGEYNPSGNYYLVRQRDAHAWVEAYIDGRGWLRVDATPAAQEALGAAVAGGDGESSRLFRAVDRLRLEWYSLVVGYDLDRQSRLLGSLSQGLTHPQSLLPDPGRPATWLLAGLVLTACLPLALAWRRRPVASPVDALYRDLLRRLAHCGLDRGAQEGPRDFARRAAAELVRGQHAVEAITDAYVRHRYGRQIVPRSEVERLRMLLGDVSRAR